MMPARSSGHDGAREDRCNRPETWPTSAACRSSRAGILEVVERAKLPNAMARRDTIPRDITFEDAAALDPEEFLAELEEGRLVPVSRGTWRHGRITGKVYFVLELYARAHPGWVVATADPGSKLRRDPDTLRGPDVGMIRAEREPTGRGANGWLDGAPDLVVEVKGDDATLAELERKAAEYLAAGARLVWVVDPDDELVIALTSNRRRVVSRHEPLDAGDLLPGFTCNLDEIFA
jgi:Uma2 family endonuclease